MSDDNQQELNEAERAKGHKQLEKLQKLLTQIQAGEGQDSDATKQFFDSMTEESDRGCVLVGFAYIDEALEQLLRSALIDDEKFVKSLFKGHGALLSNYGAKTLLCSALELIDKDTYDALNKIRTIRNAYAHRRTVTELDVSVKDLLPLLEPYQRVFFQAMIKAMVEHEDPALEQANRMIVATVVAELCDKLNKTVAVAKGYRRVRASVSKLLAHVETQHEGEDFRILDVNFEADETPTHRVTDDHLDRWLCDAFQLGFRVAESVVNVQRVPTEYYSLLSQIAAGDITMLPSPTEIASMKRQGADISDEMIDAYAARYAKNIQFFQKLAGRILSRASKDWESSDGGPAGQ